MKKMKTLVKIVGFSIVTLALLLVAALFLLPPLLGPYLKPVVEEKISELAPGQLSLEKLDWVSAYPFHLRWKSLEYTDPSLGLSARIASGGIKVKAVQMRAPSKGFLVDVDLENPQVSFTVKDSEPVTDKEDLQASTTPKTETSTPLHLSLKITNGWSHLDLSKLDLPVQSLKLLNMNSQISKRDLLNWKKPLALTFRSLSELETSHGRLTLPVSIEAQNLFAGPQRVYTEELSLGISGLHLNVSGQSQLTEPSYHAWKGKIEIADVDQLTVPPQFLPPGNWSGGIFGQFDLRLKESQPPYLSAQFQTKDLKGNINWKKEKDFHLKGPLTLTTSVSLIQHQSLNIPQLKFKLNGDALSIDAPPYLKKKPGTPFRIQIESKGKNQKLTLNSSYAQLSSWKIKSQGAVHLTPGSHSDLTLEIPSSSLSGLEKLVPLLAQKPLKGEVTAKVRWFGDLTQPMKAQVVVDPLRLKKVSGYLDLNQEGLLLKGPASINADINLRAQGKELLQSQFQTQMGLSSLDIKYKDIFVKLPGSPLSFQIQGRTQQKTLRLSSSQLIFPGGLLGFAGSLSSLEKPQIQMNFDLKKLSLAKISQSLPPLKKWSLGGQVQSRFQLQGQFDPQKGIESSPLKVSGQIKAHIPYFSVPEEKPSPQTGAQGNLAKDSAPPQPLLPPWPIVQNSKIQLNGKIDQLKMKGLALQNLSVQSQYRSGHMIANGQIGNLWRGQVTFSGLSTDLRQTLPTATMDQVQIQGLDLRQALTWAKPEYKNSASGQVSFQGALQVPHPQSPHFLKKISSQGQFQAQNLILSSLDINQIIKDKLAQYPQLKNKVHLKDQKAKLKVSSNIDVKSGRGNLTQTEILSDDGNLLRGQGWVDFDMNNQFLSTVWIANPKIKLCKKQLDSTGRLKIKNIKIKNSKWENSTQVLGQVAGKFLNCELEKGKKQLERDLEKKGKKLLKDLFGGK